MFEASNQQFEEVVYKSQDSKFSPATITLDLLSKIVFQEQ